MKKTINYTAAILAAALLSGAAAAATPDLEGDIVHGNGAVAASPATPYVRHNSGPNGTETDLLWNMQEFDQSRDFVPYQLTSGEQDNRDDLRDHVS